MRMGDYVKSESRFLKKEDVKEYGQGGVILTISHVEIDNVGMDDKPEEKPVIHWKNPGIKPMILNKTNWGNMQLALGVDDETDSEDLRGCRVVVWADPTIKYMGKIVGGLAIKPIQVDGPPVAPPRAPAEPQVARPARGRPPSPPSDIQYGASAADGLSDEDIPW